MRAEDEEIRWTGGSTDFWTGGDLLRMPVLIPVLRRCTGGLVTGPMHLALTVRGSSFLATVV